MKEEAHLSQKGRPSRPQWIQKQQPGRKRSSRWQHIIQNSKGQKAKDSTGSSTSKEWTVKSRQNGIADHAMPKSAEYGRRELTRKARCTCPRSDKRRQNNGNRPTPKMTQTPKIRQEKIRQRTRRKNTRKGPGPEAVPDAQNAKNQNLPTGRSSSQQGGTKATAGQHQDQQDRFHQKDAQSKRAKNKMCSFCREECLGKTRSIR